MSILKKHIAKYVLSAIAIVLLALIGLQLFILFVNQIQDIGKGSYDLFTVGQVVFFQLPYQIYLFFPMASLLGALIGLGQLANQNELVVMRASGMSISQITFSVLMIGLVLMLSMSLLGETLVPKFSKLATDKKMEALTGGKVVRTPQGIWFRYHNDFIYVFHVVNKTELENVVQFHFDANFQLKFMRKIEKLLLKGAQWEGVGVSETSIESEKIHTQKTEKITWEVFLEPTILSVSGIEPDEMSLKQLYQYLIDTKKNHQNNSQVELVFFSRLIQPFSTLVMILLAIPFIFGPLRQSTIGAKMLLGACCGFLFYIFDHFLGAASLVFQISPLFAALFPTTLFMLLGVILLKQAR